ncbi:transglycosylase domain-containing protein [Echinicola marina]|uniref:transglycosylase domain-containing protein n=1 Tax=Echinicola marina TaxID=2859768 RepID=UPI001CF6230B|nr:transglycosylase domain-containing protein [Echinicola marina]UCS94811.1 transglycosylase domain-containing protein [Echinicola marina]
MKKIKIGLLSLGILLSLIFTYYFIIVMNARAKTPEILHHALSPDQIKLELSDLTKKQLDELLKIQDPNFYHHKGFDISTPGAGVTTISQGLVKLFYFERFKPGIAKIKQSLIARYAFDPLTPKDTILKLFINHAYMGQGNRTAIYGFANAAEFYFDKPFRELSHDEYLALIAMIRAPNAFHFINKREANDLRVQRMKRYLSGKYIPKDNSDFLYDRQ